MNKAIVAFSLLGILNSTACIGEEDAVNHTPVAEEYRNTCMKQTHQNFNLCECYVVMSGKIFDDERFREIYLLQINSNSFNGLMEKSDEKINHLSPSDSAKGLAEFKRANMEIDPKCSPYAR